MTPDTTDMPFQSATTPRACDKVFAHLIAEEFVSEEKSPAYCCARSTIPDTTDRPLQSAPGKRICTCVISPF
jgi:hypothetical protein